MYRVASRLSREASTWTDGVFIRRAGSRCIRLAKRIVKALILSYLTKIRCRERGTQ